jgi:hypothetical protein
MGWTNRLNHKMRKDSWEVGELGVLMSFGKL